MLIAQVSNCGLNPVQVMPDLSLQCSVWLKLAVSALGRPVLCLECQVLAGLMPADGWNFGLSFRSRPLCIDLN